MQLTPRDTDILEAIYRFRVMRQDQIHTLFFGKSRTASQRRLELLYDHGFIDRRFLTVRASYLLSPVLYILDKRGVAHLRAERGDETMRWQTSDKQIGQQFLEHTLAINDVRIAITLACRRADYSVLIWYGESDLKNDFDRVPALDATGLRKVTSLIPDSYFVLNTPRGIAHFFLELDRGTMTLQRFQNKALAYWAYYQSGAYERRYQTKSLRVLTVTITGKRRENLWQATQKAVESTRFWFGVLNDISNQTVLNTPIWQVVGKEGYFPLIEPSA